MSSVSRRTSVIHWIASFLIIWMILQPFVIIDEFVWEHPETDNAITTMDMGRSNRPQMNSDDQDDAEEPEDVIEEEIIEEETQDEVIEEIFDNMCDVSLPVYPTVNFEDFIANINEFSINLYRNISNENENVCFSPYSIFTALGMAYEGARGQTALEMEQILGLPENDQIRWNLMQAFLSAFNTGSNIYDISTANAYWPQEGLPILDDYRDVLDNYYLAYGEELDYDNDYNLSADVINAWVENQTSGKIVDLVLPEDVRMACLVLTNAIYFKSDWKYQFDPGATVNSTFNKTNGDTTTVEMMHFHNNTIEFNYSSDENVQMLQLPYQSGDLSMYVLLPSSGDISPLESSMSVDYLDELKSNMSSEYLDIYLPKFMLKEKYRLKEDLEEMGMPTAFKPYADFSGITGDSEMWITKVIHQSYLNVDEVGTEAAAATAVIFGNCSDPDVPIPFKADHPFLFLIQHEETGQILFMGKVEEPGVCI